MQADTKKKMEALSAIGKQAPRLGEGVRIVRQHNKRPTTRAGRAELKGKKRAFWGAMVMLPETTEAPPERPPEMEYYAPVGVAGTQWSDMTADPINPPDTSCYAHQQRDATQLRVPPPQRPMGSGAPRRIDNSAPGSADQAAAGLLAMLSGQSFVEPARAPPPRVPYSRPVGTHTLGQGQPPMGQRPMGQRPQGAPTMGQRPQGMPMTQRGPGGPPMPPRPPGPPMPPHGPGMVPQQQGGGMVPQQGGGMVPRPHGLPLGPRPHGATLAPRSPGGAMIRPPGKARVVIVSPKTHWQGIPIEEIS